MEQTKTKYWWRSTYIDAAYEADIPEGAIVFGEGSMCPYGCIPEGKSEPCRVRVILYAVGKYECQARNVHDLPAHFVSCDGWDHMAVVKLEPELSRHYVPGRLIERNGERVE